FYILLNPFFGGCATFNTDVIDEEELAMRQREMMNLVGGLIVGFIIGALVVGAADVDLFGTAADDNNDNNDDVVEVEREYYLVTIDELEEWLGSEEGAD